MTANDLIHAFPDDLGTRLAQHQSRCYKIFKHVEAGSELYVRIDDVVDWPEDSDVTTYEQYIHVSILSDEIIAYDSELFYQENSNQTSGAYRPYFIQFTIPVHSPEQFQKLSAIGRYWYLAKFTTDQDQRMELEPGTFYLDGALETSASPVVYIQGRLLIFSNRSIKQDILKQIRNVYDPQKFAPTYNDVVETILNRCWDRDSLQTIDVYNVGHGNADYLRGSHRRILYDIGYNYRCCPNRRPHKSRYWRAVSAIRRLKPDCVILSHWDLDHIIGCAYAQQQIFDVPWIAPHLISNKDSKASVNAVRLANYLNYLGNLYLVDRNQTTYLIATVPMKSGTVMELRLGNATGSRMLSVRNKEGLFLDIYGTSHILLGGDVPYHCMSLPWPHKIDYMHVPHHGSAMEIPLLNHPNVKGTLAVISTNRLANGNLNRNNYHYNMLMQAFRHVMCTIDNSSNDDEQNLSIQITCKNRHYHIR